MGSSSSSQSSMNRMQSLDAQSVQQSAQPSASVADSMVPELKKKQIAINTKKFLSQLAKSKKQVKFTEIRGFCRPLQGTAHNVETAFDDEKANEENAIRGSKGWHHVMCILTDEDGKEYVCDKMESVRFGNVDLDVRKELTGGHLKQIFCSEKINLSSSELASFVKKQSEITYNAVNRNCINFLYDLVSTLLPEIDEWKSKDKFWAFTKARFTKEGIGKGQYKKQQNDYKQLIMEKTKKLLEKLQKNGTDLVFEEIDICGRRVGKGSIEVLLVLTDNKDQKYLCDARRDYVRFVAMDKKVSKKLLIEYGLKMVHTDDISLKVTDFCRFVEADEKIDKTGNSLNFAAYVAVRLLKLEEFQDQNTFVAFMNKQFPSKK